MAERIEMPRYGANMEEGIVGEWFVQEGSPVEEGQALCSIEIEKLTNELTSPVSGVLEKILVQEGDGAACGEPIALILTEGDENQIDSETAQNDEKKEISADAFVMESVDSAAKQTKETEKINRSTGGQVPTEKPSEIAGRTAPDAFVSRGSGKRPITPKALKYAQKRGLAWKQLAGSGTGYWGMITRDDLKAAEAEGKLMQGAVETEISRAAASASPAGSKGLASPAAAAESAESISVPVSASRSVTARRMMESLQTSAQAAIWMDADVTQVLENIQLYRETWRREGYKLGITPIVIAAAAEALRRHPQCRTIMTQPDAMYLLQDVHIGLAVDTPKGLRVPVLRHADRKTVKEIAADAVEAAEKAVIGALSAESMQGQSMSISNLGMYGVSYMRPVLNPPESVILGVGAASQRFEPGEKGGFRIRQILPLSLTFDHRVVDGAQAAQFLQDIARTLGKSHFSFT